MCYVNGLAYSTCTVLTCTTLTQFISGCVCVCVYVACMCDKKKPAIGILIRKNTIHTHSYFTPNSMFGVSLVCFFGFYFIQLML